MTGNKYWPYFQIIPASQSLLLTVATKSITFEYRLKNARNGEKSLWIRSKLPRKDYPLLLITD